MYNLISEYSNFNWNYGAGMTHALYQPRCTYSLGASFVLNCMNLNINQELLFYMQSPVGIYRKAEGMEQMVSADYNIVSWKDANS